MMDDAGLRAELRKLIEDEVQQQLTQYRGVVNAELSVIGKKLKTDMEKVNKQFTSLANDILASNKLRVAQGIEQAQGIAGTWVRAILFGAFILAGVGRRRVDRYRLDRTAIQMAGGEKRGDRRTDRRSRGHPGPPQSQDRRPCTDRPRQRWPLLRPVSIRRRCDNHPARTGPPRCGSCMR